MRYTKHIITFVISEDENEVVIQGLTDALERLQDVQEVTLYGTEWQEEDAPEPENAAEAAD